jgi:hypothetical protein
MIMKNILKIFPFILVLSACNSKDREVENLYTFTKLYGYVRWFYPSDEAASIDWNRFAVFGVQTVKNSKNGKELKSDLLKLFKPIAPALQLSEINNIQSFNLKSIIPVDTSEYVAWKHYGVSLSVYSGLIDPSFRVIDPPAGGNNPEGRSLLSMQ